MNHNERTTRPSPIRPAFDMGQILLGPDERIARYTFRVGSIRREGVCVAKATPDGGMNLMIGETAWRIKRARMMVGDGDSLVRTYTGLVPTSAASRDVLSVDYTLPGKVITARFVSPDEARPRERTRIHRADAIHTTGKEPSMTRQEQPAHQHAQNPTRQARRWPRVNFPNAFVRPYSHTAKDGRTWDMMAVTIPKGTRMHGVEMGGWRFSAFADRYNTADKINGRPVTISFRPDRPVELYRGKGETHETMRIDDPWDLCRAVKAGQNDYRATHQQERDTDAPTHPHAESDVEDVWEGGIDIARNEHYTVDGAFDPADPMTMSAPQDNAAPTR